MSLLNHELRRNKEGRMKLLKFLAMLLSVTLTLGLGAMSAFIENIYPDNEESQL